MNFSKFFSLAMLLALGGQAFGYRYTVDTQGNRHYRGRGLNVISSTTFGRSLGWSSDCCGEPLTPGSTCMGTRTWTY